MNYTSSASWVGRCRLLGFGDDGDGDDFSGEAWMASISGSGVDDGGQ